MGLAYYHILLKLLTHILLISIRTPIWNQTKVFHGWTSQILYNKQLPLGIAIRNHFVHMINARKNLTHYAPCKHLMGLFCSSTKLFEELNLVVSWKVNYLDAKIEIQCIIFFLDYSNSTRWKHMNYSRQFQ